MLLTDIFLTEGAISVVEIEDEAYRRLEPVLEEMLRKDANQWIYSANYYAHKEGRELSPLETHEEAMRLYNAELQQRSSSGAYAWVYKSSDILTKLLQEFALKQFRSDPNNADKPDGAIVDGHYYPISHVRVNITHHKLENNYKGVMHRQQMGHTFYVHSDDIVENHRFTGCKVYVDKETLLRNYESALSVAIGDALEIDIDYPVSYWIQSFLGQITETFSHEVDHFLHYMRRKAGAKHDLSYIRGEFQKQDDKKYPRRGRRTWSGEIDDTYLSNVPEIQAFATGAASVIVHNLARASRFDWSIYHGKDWNKQIDDAIREIVDGKSHLSSSLYRYRNSIRSKVDKKDYRKVWTKFLRLVIDKLQAYKRD